MVKRYPVNQSPLYRLESKSRLAEILKIALPKLLALVRLGDDNYRTFILEKETCPFTGKVKKERAVQQPKPDLNRVQERLKKLLMRLDPPSFAHAAVKGRSYRTNAVIHAHGRRVATFDISSFYSSTSGSRVYSFFREQMLCSHDVAQMLSQLTCYGFQRQAKRIALPTGSPISPILSLFANATMFEELNQLALSQKLLFSCYVDDLTFSGAYLPVGLTRMVEKILFRHGHTLSENKTRLFSSDQSKHVTGVVLKDGTVRVPYSRFKKARRLEAAMVTAVGMAAQKKLTEKLAGLLGEAAHLDERYLPWAHRLYKELRRY